MDFAIEDDVIALGEAARRFAQTKLESDIVARNRAGTVSLEEWRGLWKTCAEYGVLGLGVPTEFGGAGYDIQTTVHILQEIGYGCEDTGLTFGLNAQIWSMQMPIIEFASDVQKEKYLPSLIKGEAICCHAITEAHSGSDAMALSTTADKVDGGFVLNGSKTLIGMAPVCDMAIVFATCNRDHGAWGVSAFLVDSETDGFIRGPQQQKMGIRTLPSGSLEFKDCFVPTASLLGHVGSGNAIFNRSLEWERRFIFSSQLGAMRKQLDDCIAYAREREVFGASINTYQSVSNRLADMQLRYETSRLLLCQAAWESDQGISDTARAAMTKLHLSEAYLASSIDAMRTFGGKGYLEETGIERNVRDALGGILLGGTTDIQRQIISTSISRK